MSAMSSSAQAPGYEQPDGKRIPKARGQGRGQPCMQQGMIVQTVDFPRDEFESRKVTMPKRKYTNTDIVSQAAFQAAEQVYAPLGDPSCFQAMQGELAIAAVDDYGVTERNPLNVDSQLAVTTTVNGWPTSRDAVFAGVVRNARPLSSKDSKGTIASVGTQTIINTGPYEIMPGDDVYFSLAPLAIVTNGSLVNSPAIDEVGEPGFMGAQNEEGAVAPKFKPATYPMRDNSVYSFLRRGELAVENAFNLGGGLAPSVQAALGKARDEYREHSTDMPVHRYMELHVASYYLTHVQTGWASEIHLIPATGVFPPPPGGMDEIDKLVSGYFDKLEQKRLKFESAVGNRPAKRTKTRDTKPFSRLYDYLTTNAAAIRAGPAAHIAELQTRILEIRRQIDQAKLELVCEQHNWMRRHLIGKCLKGNTPGSGIDVACGYGHR